MVNDTSKLKMKQKDQFSSKCESDIIKNLRNLTEINGKQSAKVFSNHVVESTTGLNKLNQTEDSLKTVMYLSCWGLN